MTKTIKYYFKGQSVNLCIYIYIYSRLLKQLGLYSHPLILITWPGLTVSAPKCPNPRAILTRYAIKVLYYLRFKLLNFNLNSLIIEILSLKFH